MTNSSDSELSEPILNKSANKPRPVPASRRKYVSSLKEKENEVFDFFDSSKSSIDTSLMNKMEDDSEDDDVQFVESEYTRAAATTNPLRNGAETIPNNQTYSASSPSLPVIIKRKRSVTPPPVDLDDIDAIADDNGENISLPLPPLENFDSFAPLQVGDEYLPSKTLNMQSKELEEEIQVFIEHKGESTDDRLENSVIMYSKWLPIYGLLSQIASIRGFSRSETILVFRGAQIFSSASLGNCGALNGDELQSYHREDFLKIKAKGYDIISKALENASRIEESTTHTQDDPVNEESEDGDKMTIKVSFAKQNFKVRVSSSATISSISERCAKWNNGIAPRLSFDGALLSVDSTLADNDIEDGDSLDANDVHPDHYLCELEWGSATEICTLESIIPCHVRSQFPQMPKLISAFRTAKATKKEFKKQVQAAEPKKKTSTHRFKLRLEEEEKVLFVGEGNFSFAVSMAYSIHRADNFYCTSYDSRAVCMVKFPDAEENVSVLTEMESQVLFEVDATKLQNCPMIKKKRFDKIVFNFPHVGAGIKDQARNILANQTLLSLFFQSARKQLSENGQIIVTLKLGDPYDKWNIKSLGRENGLKVVRSFEFVPSYYEGYAHRRTIGFDEEKSAAKNEEILKKSAKTYVFQV